MTKMIGWIKIGDKVFPMRSLLQNFVYLLQAGFKSTSNANVVDTSNAVRTVGNYMISFYYGWWSSSGAAYPPAANDNYGIQVGSNATAVTITDYKLNTKITHGVGAGQLKYSSQGMTGLYTSGSTRSFKVHRFFANDSGGDVTIREVGLCMYPGGAGGPFYTLISRDLTGDITVTTGNAVPVEITIQITA